MPSLERSVMGAHVHPEGDNVSRTLFVLPAMLLHMHVTGEGRCVRGEAALLFAVDPAFFCQRYEW